MGRPPQTPLMCEYCQTEWEGVAAQLRGQDGLLWRVFSRRDEHWHQSTPRIGQSLEDVLKNWCEAHLDPLTAIVLAAELAPQVSRHLTAFAREEFERLT